jgi:hypothetical protein
MDCVTISVEKRIFILLLNRHLVHNSSFTYVHYTVIHRYWAKALIEKKHFLANLFDKNTILYTIIGLNILSWIILILKSKN